MNSEVWKDIKGYKNLYQVSNLGNIKTLDYNHTKREKLLKPILQKDGYLGVNLMKNGKRKRHRIHRLVAETFLSNKNNFPIINHKNGIKTDNKANNLEWCTSKYNTKHAINNGLIKIKKVIYQDLQKGTTLTFKNVKEASDYLGININTLYYYVKNSHKHKKIIFQYIEGV